MYVYRNNVFHVYTLKTYYLLFFRALLTCLSKCLAPRIEYVFILFFSFFFFLIPKKNEKLKKKNQHQKLKQIKNMNKLQMRC